MYSGSNPSAIRSRNYLYNAFVQLLSEKPYKGIQIKEICERAGLSRQTFYGIFDSKDELLSYFFDRLCEEFLETLPGDPEDSLALNRHFFQFFYLHRDFLELLSANRMTYLLEDQVARHFRMSPEASAMAERSGRPDYFIAMLSGAMTQLLLEWSSNGFDLSVDELSDLAVRAAKIYSERFCGAGIS